MLILNRILSIFLRHLFLNEQQYPFHIFLEINIEKTGWHSASLVVAAGAVLGTRQPAQGAAEATCCLGQPRVPSDHCLLNTYYIVGCMLRGSGSASQSASLRSALLVFGLGTARKTIAHKMGEGASPSTGWKGNTHPLQLQTGAIFCIFGINDDVM